MGDDEKEKETTETQESFKEIREGLRETRAITENNAQMIAQSVKNTEESRKQHEEQEKKSQGRFNKFKEEYDEYRLIETVETTAWKNISRLLKDYGVDIHRVHKGVWPVKGNWAIDVLAVNEEEIVVVATEVTLTCNDVYYFIKRSLKNIMSWVPEHKGKKVYGAVAYIKTKKSAEYGDPVEYALKEGLFVISVVGDTAEMLNDKDFRPKAF